MDKAADEYFMDLALKEAKQAYARDEVPVGAVVAYGKRVIATAHNRVEERGEAIAHAELLALQKACQELKTKYLPGCTLYVTLEPCIMCAGACYWTQVGRLVFGAKDEKRGYQRCGHFLIHPKTVVEEGILAERSRGLMQNFFQEIRKSSLKKR